MGSFNETCALSNLNIGCGDKVKLLFLTENPYDKNRGCYHYDHWFVRTPPISGTYDDYGRCKFKPGPVSKLITQMFDKDAVERPYGHNPYHDPPVVRGRGLPAYLNAAWEGRLKVQDEYTVQPKEAPEHWPTWQRVHAIFKKAKLPLQMDGKDTDGTGGKAGYNAQPVAGGVVCVTWNAYEGEEKKLREAEKLLKETYDCLLTYRIPSHKSDPHLMVAPKGAMYAGSHELASGDPRLIFDKDAAKRLLTEGGGYDRPSYRELKVLAVMVRQDVWDAYSGQTIEGSRWSKEPPVTVETHYDKLQKCWDKQIKHAKDWEEALAKLKDGDKDATHGLSLSSMLRESDMKQILFELPFQCMPGTHIGAAIEDPEFKGREELLRGVAELAQIEHVMEHLHQPWYIPPLGGQEGHWELRTAILQKVAALSAAELKKEQDEYEGDNDE